MLALFNQDDLSHCLEGNSWSQTFKRKRFVMPSCCRFCYSAEEDIHHIFLQCDFAISIWNILQSTFKFQINRPIIRWIKVNTDRSGIEWKRPIIRWIKVNTDGPVIGSLGIAGYGAELWGVVTAVEYAIRFQWTHLWFECDATYVVDLLQNKSKNVPWKFLTR
ncbi:hypothetical protein TIFTF001_031685 [Ficus carica]|uniref:RNase H type-1 domain-containing protein n=1 Tax=Ficus carica TaxID=3494 RepID=A0AA88DVE4_FICCA|nr:hypothetical protein TIFTF001_031685 [Ficus carica]